MSQVSSCVESLKSLADLQEEVLKEFCVPDLSMGTYKIEKVTVAALFEDHHWLSNN